jgi:hypothetical protein
MLKEQDLTLQRVSTPGTEAPPDTFKDDPQAADGSYGRDGVFHAKQLRPSARPSMRRSPVLHPPPNPAEHDREQNSGSSGWRTRIAQGQPSQAVQRAKLGRFLKRLTDAHIQSPPVVTVST